ncbi:MAG: metallophosphoesterase [Acidobacteriota bacterium]|nr:metallophosphoesterase [Acidobacteriota bacterium]
MQWKYIKGIALGLAGAMLWGTVIEPRLVDFKEEYAEIPDLPEEWENKRVALIADFQVGMWFGNESTVTKIVNRIVKERPAAVFIAGDFVYKPTNEDESDEVEREDTHDFTKIVDRAVALVRPLAQTQIPVYAVLGNHDYGMGYPDSIKNEQLATALREKLESAGVRVLENEAVPLALPTKKTGENNSNNSAAHADSTVYLIGIGSRYAGCDKPEIALSQLPANAPRIVLMHNPDSFPAFPSNTAPFALAGHTHGGQVRIPFTKNWSWMSLFSPEKIHNDGWIANVGQPGNRLYVNRGIGFSSFPIRINCRPELTVFTLRGGNDVK